MTHGEHGRENQQKPSEMEKRTWKRPGRKTLEYPMMETQCDWIDLFPIPNDAVTKMINYWTERGIYLNDTRLILI